MRRPGTLHRRLHSQDIDVIRGAPYSFGEKRPTAVSGVAGAIINPTARRPSIQISLTESELAYVRGGIVSSDEI